FFFLCFIFFFRYTFFCFFFFFFFQAEDGIRDYKVTGVQTCALLIWPALLAAVFLAWTQALMWMPYGLPGLRAIVTVPWLATLDAVVLLAIHYRVREPMMVAFLAPQLPLAYVTACSAVGRARRGEVPDWRGMVARPASNAVLTRRREHFPSPARAQAWFEWRRHGRSLPALVGLLLPFELALLWLAKDAPAF